jgi:hypothetical protein
MTIRRLYHGTSAATARVIARDGLREQSCLSDAPRLALSYAFRKAVAEQPADTFILGHACHGAVITFDVDDALLAAEGFTLGYEGAAHYVTSSALEPGALVAWETHEFQPSAYERLLARNDWLACLRSPSDRVDHHELERQALEREAAMPPAQRARYRERVAALLDALPDSERAAWVAGDTVELLIRLAAGEPPPLAPSLPPRPWS